MALVIHCPSCRKNFKIPERAKTRVDLEHKTGEYFKKICLNCAAEHEYHVNDVRAEADPMPAIYALIAAVIFFLFFFLIWRRPFIALAISGMIFSIGAAAGSVPSSFNSYSATRTRDEARNRQIREEVKYRRGDSNYQR